ncbi:hypothetical protein JCM3774_000140 [Rhodotorula dairenensis]
MDIQALRARALETKKRKRLRPETSTPPVLRVKDDLEEGEIDDAAAAPTGQAATNGRLRTSTLAAGNEHASAPAPPGLPRAPSAPPSPPASYAAVREQSKQVVAELLSYGVPPAYLLSIGISPQTLSTSFRDLDVDVALPFPSDTAAASVASNDRASETVGSANQSSEPTPVPGGVDLTALEARKREELLARKAALLARNRQHAQSLESELDSLFSAAPAMSSSDEATSPIQAAPEDAAAAATAPGSGRKKRQQKRTRKKRRLDASAAPFAPDTAGRLQTTLPALTAQAVHDLRESIDHTEEVVNTPQGGPFASEGPHASTSLAASSSHLAMRSSRPTRSRPTATEFEHDPAVRLSSNSLMRGRTGRAFIADEPVRMIIEISDDEDGSDDDGPPPDERNGSSSSRDLRHTQDQRENSETGRVDSSSRNAGPSPPSAAEDVGPEEIERRRQLQEKESAIRKMMERIAEIERRKKELGKGRPPDSAPMSRSASSDTAAVDKSAPPGSDTVSATDAPTEEVAEYNRRFDVQ